jgi:uncharacterized protein YndB with AHSA1/START domain
MQKNIFQTRFFQQPPGEVWEYLTRPELLEQWLGKSDFKPVVGHKFHFVSPYGNHSYCEVLEVMPFTKLCYSWQKISLNDNMPFNSKIVWTLIEKENGTELQLEHGGFAFLEDSIAHSNGWDACFSMLANTMHANTVAGVNP